jgi:hypothetical protein
MTLIAAFEYEGSPVLLGDLLITRAGDATHPSNSTPLVHLPNSLIPVGSGYSISGMAQKLVLIHEHLCMAWAGSLINATALARHLRSFVADKSRLDYQELRSLLEDYPRADYGNIDLIIYSWHGNGTGWFSNLAAFDLEPLNNLRVSGTGRDRFIQNIGNLEGQHTASLSNIGYQSVAMRAMALASLASAQQVFEGIGITHRWGGGFELVTFDGQRLQKVDRVLTVHWNFEEVEDGAFVARLLPSFIYQFYVGDTVCFWVDEAEESGRPNRQYQVTPPFPSPDVEFSKPRQFLAEWVISLVNVRRHRTKVVGTFVDFTKPGGEPGLQMNNSDTAKTTVKISREFFQNFFSSLPSGVRVVAIDLWGVTSTWPP